MSTAENTITWNDFSKVDIRVGTVVEAESFTKAHNPSYKMTIDFGDLGVLKSSAQITRLYEPEELIGRQVIAVVNFPPKQIANMKSECLVLGCVGEDPGEIVLLATERPVKNGLKIG